MGPRRGSPTNGLAAMTTVDFVVYFLILASIGAALTTVLVGVLVGTFRLLGKRLIRESILSFITSASASVILFVVIILLFQEIVPYYRYDDSGQQIQQGDYSAYIHWARRAFYAVHAATLVGSGVIGFLVGRRVTGRGGPLAITAAGTVLLFMLLSLPITDFLNACFVGQSLVLNERRC
jgi:hypothetical protein